MAYLNWRFIEKHVGWATRMTEEDAAGWDGAAAGWNKRTEFENTFTQAQINALTKITGEDSVLDACCGTGRLTIPLARKAARVTGLDAGAHMLGFCKDYVEREKLTNVTLVHKNWHKSTPGVDFPKHDIAVACISPAQADIVKLSSAATKYCYSLSFTGPAFRFCMAELFAGCNNRFSNIPLPKDRDCGLNVPFNILYDLGALPEVNYVYGGWEHTSDTREELITYLCSLFEGEWKPEYRKQIEENAAKRIFRAEDGTWTYQYPTSMYVLGWDPSQLDLQKELF